MMNIWQSSLWKHTQPKVMLLLFNLSPLSRSHPWLFYHFWLRVVTGHKEYWIASTPYGFSISWKLSWLINHASTIIRRFYNQWWHGKRKIWEFKNESYLNREQQLKWWTSEIMKDAITSEWRLLWKGWKRGTWVTDANDILCLPSILGIQPSVYPQD